MSTTAPVSAMTTIRFEDGPAADASGATIMCSDAGIRITFSTGETRYYYGLGAHVAESGPFGLVPFRNYKDPMRQNRLQSCRPSTRIATWALVQSAVPKLQWVVGQQLVQLRRAQSVICVNLTVVHELCVSQVHLLFFATYSIRIDEY